MIKTRARTTVAARVAKTALEQRPRRARRGAGGEVRIGVLVAWDDKGPLVDFADSRRGPVRARVVTGVARPRPGTKIPAGREVVLLVDPRSGQEPVIMGFLTPVDSGVGGATELEARIDGRRVELEGHDEIVLVCGEASITLRRNGRVVIKGTQVETRAKGVNRIKGGSVSIN